MLPFLNLVLQIINDSHEFVLTYTSNSSAARLGLLVPLEHCALDVLAGFEPYVLLDLPHFLHLGQIELLFVQSVVLKVKNGHVEVVKAFLFLNQLGRRRHRRSRLASGV